MRSDPYRVLVSEVMLQQTQAARVVPAFNRFIVRFPTLETLAAAPRSEVLREWSGLGYNRRAVALSEAAKAVVRVHRGRIPSSPKELSRLPGVGPYTAAAVASLAYGEPVAAVDTNVHRVVARVLLGVDGPEAPPARVRDATERWLGRRDSGGFNQAVMDLGREVCRPVPRCEMCPLAGRCRFRRSGRALSSARRRQPAFEGSLRQVRGRVVELLRARGSASLDELATAIGAPPGRIAEAVRALSGEGIVRADPAALAGRLGGRAKLAD